MSCILEGIARMSPAEHRIAKIGNVEFVSECASGWIGDLAEESLNQLAGRVRSDPHIFAEGIDIRFVLTSPYECVPDRESPPVMEVSFEFMFNSRWYRGYLYVTGYRALA